MMLGTPPATMSGNHTALMVQFGSAPLDWAALVTAPPKATPKFIAAAPRPLRIAHDRPAENGMPFPCFCAPFSLCRPATEQTDTPATTRTTPAITPSPEGVKIFSGCN